MSRPKHRSFSAELVDLHVFIVPVSLWIERYKTAYNNVLLESTSAGFIRVSPSLYIDELRHQIYDQLGKEDLPEAFVFLRSVGRCLALVNRKQELKLRAKHFLPPFAYSPEIFILPATREAVEYRGPENPATTSNGGDTLIPSPYSSYNSDAALGGDSQLSSPTHVPSDGGSTFDSQDSSRKEQSNGCSEDDVAFSRELVSPRDDPSEMLTESVSLTKLSFNKLKRLNNSKLRRSTDKSGQSSIPTLPEINTMQPRLTANVIGPSQSPPPSELKSGRGSQQSANEDTNGDIRNEGSEERLLNELRSWGSGHLENGESRDEKDELLPMLQIETPDNEQHQEEEQQQQAQHQSKEEEEEEEGRQRIRQEVSRSVQAQQKLAGEYQRLEEENQRIFRYEKRLKQVEEEKLLKRSEDERRRYQEREEDEIRRRNVEKESEEKIQELQKLIQLRNENETKEREAAHRKAESEAHARYDKMKQIEETRASLGQIKGQKLELHKERDDILRSIKKINYDAEKEQSADSIWRRKFLDEKRQTKSLEEQLLGIRNSLDEEHKRMVSSLNATDETRGNTKTTSLQQRQRNPSEIESQRITLQRLKTDRDDLHSRVEMTKVKLQAETKMRIQAQDELKQLRTKFTDRKITKSLSHLSSSGASPATRTQQR